MPNTISPRIERIICDKNFIYCPFKDPSIKDNYLLKEFKYRHFYNSYSSDDYDIIQDEKKINLNNNNIITIIRELNCI